MEVSTWPAHGVFTRNGKTFYVSSETAGNLAAIDTASRKIIYTVGTGGDAMGLALTADQPWLYAVVGEEQKLVKVDTATNTAVGTIPLPGIVHDSGRPVPLRDAPEGEQARRSADRSDRLVTTIP